MQNKANFLKAKNNATNCAANTYENKPAFAVQENKAKSKPISNAQTAYSACRTRDCHVAAGLARTCGDETRRFTILQQARRGGQAQDKFWDLRSSDNDLLGLARHCLSTSATLFFCVCKSLQIGILETVARLQSVLLGGQSSFVAES
jgi:hypothetical protein